MPGLDPSVAVHHLAIDPAYQPVKQEKVCAKKQVNAEVDKFIQVDFIEPTMYCQWLSSIVPCLKKNAKIRRFQGSEQSLP